MHCRLRAVSFRLSRARHGRGVRLEGRAKEKSMAKKAKKKAKKKGAKKKKGK